MTAYYQAGVQVIRDKESWQYDSSPRLNSLAKSMDWLANNGLSYEKNAEAYVDVIVDGLIVLSWEFTNGHCVTRV